MLGMSGLQSENLWHFHRRGKPVTCLQEDDLNCPRAVEVCLTHQPHALRHFSGLRLQGGDLGPFPWGSADLSRGVESQGFVTVVIGKY